MSTIYGSKVTDCPSCSTAIGSEHPYTWCAECGNPLPDAVRALIPSLVASATAREDLATRQRQSVKSHVSESGDLQCIACGSNQLHSGPRGYSFFGGGIFGSAQIVITCLKCGQKFKPGGQPY